MSKEESDFWWQIKGIAILAVIAIHSCLNRDITLKIIIGRQFINFPVILFIFMSGYFVNGKKIQENPEKWVISRLKKIIIPYLIWSGIYLLYAIYIKGITVNYKGIISSLILGTSNVQMYYSIVLLQLILLTPVLVKYVKSHWIMVACLGSSFVFLLLKYLYELRHNISSIVFSLCGVWLFFYYYGIWMRTRGNRTNSAYLSKCVMVLAAFVLDICEAIVMYNTEYYHDFGTSQVRVSNFLLGICIIRILCDSRTQRLKKFSGLIWLGKKSFSIYLAHMLVLDTLYIIFPRVNYIVTFLVVSLFTAFLIVIEEKLKKIWTNLVNGNG